MAHVEADASTPVFGRKPLPLSCGPDIGSPRDRLRARDAGRAVDPEQGLRRLIEPLPEAAILLNDVGQVLSCNVRFADLIGSPRSIVVGQIFASYLVEHEEALFRGFLASTLSAAGRARFRLLRMDNSVIDVSIALQVLRSDTGASPMHCAIVTGSDETEDRSTPRPAAVHR